MWFGTSEYIQRKDNNWMNAWNKWTNEWTNLMTVLKYIWTFTTFFPNKPPRQIFPLHLFPSFLSPFGSEKASPVWSKCSLALGVWSHSCRTYRWQLVQLVHQISCPGVPRSFCRKWVVGSLFSWPKIRCHGFAWDEQTLQDLQSGVIILYVAYI